MIVLSMVSDIYFSEFTFNGEDYNFDMDMDEDATHEETLNMAFNQIGLKYEDYKDTDLEDGEHTYMFNVSTKNANIYIQVEVW